MTDADELISLLSRRGDLLSVLTDRPTERYELVDRVPASKSTVYKGVSQLADLGLIERTARGLEPTLLGTLAYERYRELADVTSFAPLLAAVSHDGFLEPAALGGATVVTPTEHDIDRHLVHVERLLREADRIRGFSPIVSPRYVAAFYERARNGIDAELVLETALVDRIASTDPRTLEAILALGNVSIYRTDAELPFGLAIGEFDGDERVVIELPERGTMAGVITNDSPGSRRWAKRVYEEFKTTATPVEPADVEGVGELEDAEGSGNVETT